MSKPLPDHNIDDLYCPHCHHEGLVLEVDFAGRPFLYCPVCPMASIVLDDGRLFDYNPELTMFDLQQPLDSGDEMQKLPRLGKWKES